MLKWIGDTFMEIQTIFRDMVIQSFLNLGCNFCDICQIFSGTWDTFQNI